MWDNQRAGASTERNNPSLASLSLVLAHRSHLPPYFLVISAALRSSLPNTPVPVVCGPGSGRLGVMCLWLWVQQTQQPPNSLLFCNSLLDLQLQIRDVFIKAVLFLWLTRAQHGVSPSVGLLCNSSFLSSTNRGRLLTTFPECIVLIIFKRGCWGDCTVCFAHVSRWRERWWVHWKPSVTWNRGHYSLTTQSHLGWQNECCLFCLW